MASCPPPQAPHQMYQIYQIHPANVSSCQFRDTLSTPPAIPPKATAPTCAPSTNRKGTRSFTSEAVLSANGAPLRGPTNALLPQSSGCILDACGSILAKKRRIGNSLCLSTVSLRGQWLCAKLVHHL